MPLRRFRYGCRHSGFYAWIYYAKGRIVLSANIGESGVIHKGAGGTKKIIK